MSRFTPKTVAEFYAEHVEKPFFPNLAAHMTSDVSIGMELVHADAVTSWRSVIGPTNSATAKAEAPNSIRG